MKDRVTEINEAIQAADDTLDHLYAAKKKLGSAGNWGILDMLGGDFLSTLMKRKNMRDAENELEEAKYAIQNLAKELRDVTDVVRINIEMDDFLGFADYFFDGLIADWIVQSRISTAKQQISDAITKIELIRNKLQELI